MAVWTGMLLRIGSGKLNRWVVTWSASLIESPALMSFHSLDKKEWTIFGQSNFLFASIISQTLLYSTMYHGKSEAPRHSIATELLGQENQLQEFICRNLLSRKMRCCRIMFMVIVGRLILVFFYPVGKLYYHKFEIVILLVTVKLLRIRSNWWPILFLPRSHYFTRNIDFCIVIYRHRWHYNIIIAG